MIGGTSIAMLSPVDKEMMRRAFLAGVRATKCRRAALVKTSKEKTRTIFTNNVGSASPLFLNAESDELLSDGVDSARQISPLSAKHEQKEGNDSISAQPFNEPLPHR